MTDPRILYHEDKEWVLKAELDLSERRRKDLKDLYMLDLKVKDAVEQKLSTQSQAAVGLVSYIEGLECECGFKNEEDDNWVACCSRCNALEAFKKNNS
jgi:hypothetical protein